MQNIFEEHFDILDMKQLIIKKDAIIHVIFYWVNF